MDHNESLTSLVYPSQCRELFNDKTHRYTLSSHTKSRNRLIVTLLMKIQQLLKDESKADAALRRKKPFSAYRMATE